MPKINSLLAEKGATFENAFVSESLCCPYRATILTGLYAHNSGIKGNTWPRPSQSLWVRSLRGRTGTTSRRFCAARSLTRGARRSFWNDSLASHDQVCLTVTSRWRPSSSPESTPLLAMRFLMPRLRRTSRQRRKA
jgi:hypothetical protein